MLTNFFQLFSFDFARMALCATVLISLTCGLLSPVVVLKQRSYLGDTLSHLVFPGVVAGILCSQFMSMPQWGCVVVGAAVTALLGTFISEWILKKLQCPPDSAAIVCLTTFFALGIVLISSNKGVRISPDSIFFGDVLTLNKIDLTVIFSAFILVAVAIISLKKHWDAWLVDTEFAEIAGFRVGLLNKLFPVLLTASVLSGLFAVGGLMISALITIPTLLYAPRSVFSFTVVLFSLGIGLLGFALAFLFNWPVGPTIVLVGFACLICKTCFKK
ncbi:MAG: metal ABC transporter permease [Bdellovibrionota bacterium]